MDIETRGLISEIVNYVFEKQNVLETVNWILEADEQVRSKEDLALGYFMGSLMKFASNVVSRRKLEEKAMKQHKKRLEKALGKEEAKRELMERDRRFEEMEAKGGRRIKAEPSDEDIEDIRNMLIPHIAPFREKIRKEVALRRILSHWTDVN